jgi:hypothetical protein
MMYVDLRCYWTIVITYYQYLSYFRFNIQASKILSIPALLTNYFVNLPRSSENMANTHYAIYLVIIS